MMRIFQVVAAVLLIVSAYPAVAQSGPAEVPPASFKGQQYVDSRGCVFLRAGYGGRVEWVQRITSARQPLCGYPPTFGAADIEVENPAPAVEASEQVVAQAPKPAAAAPVVARPAAQAPVRVAAPAAQPSATAAPAQVAVAAQSPVPKKIGCYKSAPVPMIVALRGGGTVVVCTRGDGTANGWRPPVYPKGAPVGASLNLPDLAGYQMTGNGNLVVSGATPTPPQGYRMAWSDDRLNPERSLGSAAGRADQNQIWSQEVPAVQIAAAKPAKAKAKSTKATVSSNTSAAAANLYVQVGTFGVPANADGAASRLAALGLPTAKGNLTKDGKALQVVYAGPFASAAAAQNALSAARSAGFSDAFVR